jgi:hypothetical protein
MVYVLPRRRNLEFDVLIMLPYSAPSPSAGVPASKLSSELEGHPMAKFGFVVPVQPGKEDVLMGATEQIRQRMPEYEASRRRAGMTLERVWL